jgi:hypothetical protein
MDPRWVEFYPYKVRVRPGGVVIFKVSITNYEVESRSGRLRFRSVEGVNLSPQDIDFTVDGRATIDSKTKATFPKTFTTHSIPILADVTWNGRHLGEIAEAIAYW